jgi:hypothetical protein
LNPYVAADGPFVGRHRELAKLERELLRGRSALAAVMAGRGMGKTSFSRQLERRLMAQALTAVEVFRWPRTPADSSEFFVKLGGSLGTNFTGTLFDEELVDAVLARPAARTVLILDEVDALIDHNDGRPLLESIRVAWEQLAGKLGIVILGGSSLYELLASNVSPFLRNAEFVGLSGLSREEVRQLVADPCGVQISDELVDLLWQDTAGHPALINEIMRVAVDRGGDLAHNILDVIDLEFMSGLEAKYFNVWWNNLRPEGQLLYRRLVEWGAPVPRDRIASLVAAPASNWMRVLETTGVARAEQGELLPRGELFSRWVRREHFVKHEPEPTLASHLAPLVGMMAAFERELLCAVQRWGLGVIEYAGLGLLLKSTEEQRGNARLLPEAHFQLSLLLALQQHGWRVEAEGWSVIGRSDLKVERGKNHRSCIELKIWLREGYKDATEQVIGYALPTDEFAGVVMIDRQGTSLFERYSELLTDKGYDVIARAASDPGSAPQFVTKHEREGAPALRVHHYLVQLPADRST